MSSGGLAASFPPSTTIPPDYLYSLTQTIFASAAVNFFIIAFTLSHLKTYIVEGWKQDNWFFRTIVTSLVTLSILSVILQSAAAHYVLKSLYTRTYERTTLDWIDCIQRLFCLPTGIVANVFYTYRIFQISPNRSIWFLVLFLWIPAGAGCFSAEVTHIMTLVSSSPRNRFAWRICELVGVASICALDLVYAVVLGYRLWYARRNQAKPELDSVSQYFIGTVQTSFVTLGVTIGNLVTVSFLHSPKIYIYYSFWLLLLPNAWTLSVVWAINQRVFIRRKISNISATGGGGGGGRSCDGCGKSMSIENNSSSTSTNTTIDIIGGLLRGGGGTKKKSLRNVEGWKDGEKIGGEKGFVPSSSVTTTTTTIRRKGEEEEEKIDFDQDPGEEGEESNSFRTKVVHERGDDPSRWRGDDDERRIGEMSIDSSMTKRSLHGSSRGVRRMQTLDFVNSNASIGIGTPTEPDYDHYKLDTGALEALKTTPTSTATTTLNGSHRYSAPASLLSSPPPGPPVLTRCSGIWVKTETKVESHLNAPSLPSPPTNRDHNHHRKKLMSSSPRR